MDKYQGFVPIVASYRALYVKLWSLNIFLSLALIGQRFSYGGDGGQWPMLFYSVMIERTKL